MSSKVILAFFVVLIFAFIGILIDFQFDSYGPTGIIMAIATATAILVNENNKK